MLRPSLRRALRKSWQRRHELWDHGYQGNWATYQVNAYDRAVRLCMRLWEHAKRQATLRSAGL